MPTESEGVFIDTNVLIYSIFPDFEPEKAYPIAADLESASAIGYPPLCFVADIEGVFCHFDERKHLQEAPHPKAGCRKDQGISQALQFPFGKKTAIQILMELIEKYAVSRQKIHDLNIVATMIDHGVSKLLTYNKKDFKRIRSITLCEL